VPANFQLDGFVIVIGGDPAASESTTADHSAAVVLAFGENHDGLPTAHVVDVYRKQVSVPVFVDDLVALQRRWFGAPVVIEAVGGFKAVPQIMRRTNPEILVIEARVLGDKFQRAQPVAAAWNDGRILVPTVAPWLDDFLKEVRGFTGVKDDSDDQVDALSHAWNQLASPDDLFVGSSVSDPSRWK
jgi:predicted phage terminase large subunit-like protein